MTRLIANVLIVLVLFTHSSMAMDVHIPIKPVQTGHHVFASFVQMPIDQATCADAGGHCSHHQAHTTGLFSVSSVIEMQTQPVLFPAFQTFLFFHALIPPHRPPKT